MNVKLPTFECLRCGHRWHPRKPEVSVCCAWCKSPYWNTAPDRESKARENHDAQCATCRETA